MNLSKLFVMHGLITFVAGISLIVNPEMIPATINIQVLPNQYLICYLLATAELAIAFLSFGARTLQDVTALRLISLCFIIFHLSTAFIEIVAIVQGGSSKIWANIALRIIVSFLFFYYGRLKISKK